MSLIKPVLEKNAKGKVKRIFQEIKKTRKISKIPNFWRILANNSNTWNLELTHAFAAFSFLPCLSNHVKNVFSLLNALVWLLLVAPLAKVKFLGIVPSTATIAYNQNRAEIPNFSLASLANSRLPVSWLE